MRKGESQTALLIHCTLFGTWLRSNTHIALLCFCLISSVTTHLGCPLSLSLSLPPTLSHSLTVEGAREMERPPTKLFRMSPPPALIDRSISSPPPPMTGTVFPLLQYTRPFPSYPDDRKACTRKWFPPLFSAFAVFNSRTNVHFPGLSLSRDLSPVRAGEIACEGERAPSSTYVFMQKRRPPRVKSDKYSISIAYQHHPDVGKRDNVVLITVTQSTVPDFTVIPTVTLLRMVCCGVLGACGRYRHATVTVVCMRWCSGAAGAGSSGDVWEIADCPARRSSLDAACRPRRSPDRPRTISYPAWATSSKSRIRLTYFPVIHIFRTRCFPAPPLVLSHLPHNLTHKKYNINKHSSSPRPFYLWLLYVYLFVVKYAWINIKKEFFIRVYRKNRPKYIGDSEVRMSFTPNTTVFWSGKYNFCVVSVSMQEIFTHTLFLRRNCWKIH